MDRILSTIKPLPKKVEPQTEVAPEASQPVSSSVQSNLEKPFVILIDPGHGGKDNGATGNYGLKEKDVNLDISLRLRSYLTTQLKNCQNVKIEISRDSDYFLTLDERVELSKRVKADMFFCVHTNSSRFNRWNADGFETYYPVNKEEMTFVSSDQPVQPEEETPETTNNNGGSVFQIVSDLNSTSTVDDSRILAEMVQEKLAERLICADRGAKAKNLYVLKYTPMVSVLVEVGFICNPNIEANLRDPEVQKRNQ